MIEQLPVPSNIVEMAKRKQAKAAIESMQLQLALLAHVVEMLDPEHDYVFDEKNLTLNKVKKDEKDNLQSGASEDKPFRGEVPLGGEAKGLLSVSNKPNVEEPGESEGNTTEEV